jgi:uncharacterized protein
MKLPFFVWKGLIHSHTLMMDLYFLPLIPVGVWIGVWLNRRIPSQKFTHIIYIIVLLTGIELVSGKSLVGQLLAR